jgi:hypothetical protein
MRIRVIFIRVQFGLFGFAFGSLLSGNHRYWVSLNAGIILMWINLYLRDKARGNARRQNNAGRGRF